jgi:hypothetical protein
VIADAHVVDALLGNTSEHRVQLLRTAARLTNRREQPDVDPRRPLKKSWIPE